MEFSPLAQLVEHPAVVLKDQSNRKVLSPNLSGGGANHSDFIQQLGFSTLTRKIPARIQKSVPNHIMITCQYQEVMLKNT